MSVLSRKIAATPKRSVDEAWKVIVNMISEQSSEAREILESMTGVSSAIMVDEIPRETPIVVTGKGPRIRIYCVFGEDALLDDNCNEESLVQNPTAEDWHIYLPCAQEDLAWITEALKPVSKFATAYDKNKEIDVEKNVDAENPLTVDTSGFLNKL